MMLPGEIFGIVWWAILVTVVLAVIDWKLLLTVTVACQRKQDWYVKKTKTQPSKQGLYEKFRWVSNWDAVDGDDGDTLKAYTGCNNQDSGYCVETWSILLSYSNGENNCYQDRKTKSKQDRGR